MFKQYKLRNYKFILVMYVVILNVIGILLIGSAKPSVQSKQILGMIAGLTIMVMLSLIDYNFILKFSWLIYFLWSVCFCSLCLPVMMPVVHSAGLRSEDSVSSLPNWQKF